MIRLVVLLSLSAASLQKSVHVSGRYPQDSQVHVSGGAGATRVHESGSAYHAASAPHYVASAPHYVASSPHHAAPAPQPKDQYKPAAPVHQFLYRPAHRAPVHRNVY